LNEGVTCATECAYEEFFGSFKHFFIQAHKEAFAEFLKHIAETTAKEMAKHLVPIIDFVNYGSDAYLSLNAPPRVLESRCHARSFAIEIEVSGIQRQLDIDSVVHRPFPHGGLERRDAVWTSAVLTRNHSAHGARPRFHRRSVRRHYFFSKATEKSRRARKVSIGLPC
jgi:hypothetical protein